MDTVECKELIVTTLSRRGKGIKHDPVRVVMQVFEKNGTLVAEYDPRPGLFNQMDLVNYSKWLVRNEITTPSISHVHEWLDSLEK